MYIRTQLMNTHILQDTPFPVFGLQGTPLFCKMATRSRITAPELEQFIVATVQLTGRVLGAGAYGSVEEVEIPGATVAAKKLHQQLVNLGSPQQVRSYTVIFLHTDSIEYSN